MQLFCGLLLLLGTCASVSISKYYEATIWGYPFVKMTQQLSKELSQVPLNTLQRATNVLTPDTQDDSGNGTSPNSDTLYSYSWIDLRSQPMVLRFPQIFSRFYTFQFMDFSTNVIGSLSPRTNPNKTEINVIFSTSPLDPSIQLPPNTKNIVSPSLLVWYLGRVLVQKIGDPVDLQAAIDIQSQISIQSLSEFLGAESTAFPAVSPLQVPKLDTVPDDPIQFFKVLDWALQVNYNGIPNNEQAQISSFQDLLKPDSLEKSKSSLQMRIAFATAMKRIEFNLQGIIHNNLWFSSNKFGAFDDNLLLRATAAKKYLGGNLAEDALYYASYTDSLLRRLDGRNSYTLDLAEPVPANGFFSLTAYDKNHYFERNQAGVYSIGTGTVNKKLNAKGGLTIYLSVSPPLDSSLLHNWLPVPKGEFYLILRAYWPKDELASGAYKIPNVVRS